jgi:hypothetical protein
MEGAGRIADNMRRISVVATTLALLALSSACGRASATPVSTSGSGNGDAATLLRLQIASQCAQDADRYWRRDWSKPAPVPKDVILTNFFYSNHYNAELGRCLVLVNSLIVDKDHKHFWDREVYDANEGGQPIAALRSTEPENGVPEEKLTRNGIDVPWNPENRTWFDDLMKK